MLLKSVPSRSKAVSYTHLDGYKRQVCAVSVVNTTVSHVRCPYYVYVWLFIFSVISGFINRLTSVSYTHLMMPSVFSRIFEEAFGIRQVAAGGFGAVLMNGVKSCLLYTSRIKALKIVIDAIEAALDNKINKK